MNALLVVMALGLLVRFDQTGDGRWLRLLCLLSGLAVFNHAPAYDEDRDLFVVTVDQPLGGMLEGLPVLFREFPLDPTHWIYKEITKGEIESLYARLPPYLPRFGRLTVGPGEAGAPTLRAELAFEEPSRFPFPVAFEWMGPAGTVRGTTGPLVVAPHSASIAAALPAREGGRAEAWTVRARGIRHREVERHPLRATAARP